MDRDSTQNQMVHMTLDAIANDYEYLDQILQDVGKWSADADIVLDRAAVISALEKLIDEGYAQAYLLSPTPPRVQEVAYDRNRVGELAFYVTSKGKELCIRKQDQDCWTWP